MKILTIVILNCLMLAQAQDIFRSTFVRLEQENNHDLAEIFWEHLIPVLDDIQLILDKSKFCSEIHVVARKKNMK